MKLSRIEISNVLGLHRADLDISTPITMVMGSNEAGKSSLRDAVAMAMIGSPVRVKLKKEYGQLLHDDAKKGRVSLLADGEELATFKLPGGEQVCAKFAGQEFIEYVISPELTAKMTPADLRSMLFALTRCKASVDVRAQMLLDRGCNAIMVEAFKPMLRGPFPDCAKDAAERATQAKGAWRGITGENWGKDKAQGWKPEAVGPEPTQEAIDAARAEHNRIQESIDKGTKYLGGLEQRQKDAQGLATRRRELEDLAGSLKRATGKKETTDKDLAEWQAKFSDLDAKAKAARQGAVSVKCPCCDERLRIVGQSLEKYDGAEVDPKLLTELNTELVKAQNAVSMLGRTQHNDAQAIIAAQNATTELGILQQTAEPVAAETIQEAHDALHMLRQDRDKARAKVQALEGLAQHVASAKDREDRAGMAHNECMEWLKISDALSPGGIPAEILATAIKPVNDSLAILARLSGWKPVQITDDMQIVVGGRLYGLQSESSKWRADTLLALAIAQISELRFVLLDRFDVLDQAGRKQLIGTLMQLTSMGAIDQAIICGTLKEPIKGMPVVVGQVWINKGIAEAVA